MKALLPNARFLTLPSENLGRDWFEKSRQIDQSLPDLGMDLAEETIYLLYSRSPGAILEGSGECLIARAVVGPKRALEGDLRLEDWVQATVERLPLKRLSHWGELLEDCYREWENLHRQARQVAPAFMVVFKRRLESPEGSWHLSAEVLFKA
jgi:hypothetical protein